MREEAKELRLGQVYTREGIPQDIKAKVFVRKRSDTYTQGEGTFKSSNPNTQPRILIQLANGVRPSIGISQQSQNISHQSRVTQSRPVQAQAHPDSSGSILRGSRARSRDGDLRLLSTRRMGGLPSYGLHGCLHQAS